jgi:chromosome segregation ATPase
MSDQQPLTREEREAYRLEYTGNARRYSPGTQIAIIRLLDDLDRAERERVDLDKQVGDLVEIARGKDEQIALLGERLEKAERERDEANARARKAADDLMTYLLQLRTQREQIASLVSERDQANARAEAAERRLAEADARTELLRDEVSFIRNAIAEGNKQFAKIEAEATRMRLLLLKHHDEVMQELEPGDPLPARINEIEQALSCTAGRDLLARYKAMEKALRQIGEGMYSPPDSECVYCHCKHGAHNSWCPEVIACAALEGGES